MAWVAGQEIPCVSRLKSREWITMLAPMSVSTDHQERSLQILDLPEVLSQDLTLLPVVAHLVVVTMREEEAMMIEVASLKEDHPSSPEATHQGKMVLVQVRLAKVVQKRPETVALEASVAITPQEETVAVEKEEEVSAAATVETEKEEAASAAATVEMEKEEAASVEETVVVEAASAATVVTEKEEAASVEETVAAEAASVAIAVVEAAASAAVTDNQEELMIIKNLAVLLVADPASVASESPMLPVNESTVSSLAYC